MLNIPSNSFLPFFSIIFTRTHARHAHTRTHARHARHAHTRTHTRAHTHAHTHARHAHTRAHTRTHAHTRAHTQIKTTVQKYTTRYRKNQNLINGEYRLDFTWNPRIERMNSVFLNTTRLRELISGECGLDCHGTLELSI
jgi:hypothetical protein